jgi:hypothetical protein
MAHKLIAVVRRATQARVVDQQPVSVRELDALLDQPPITLVFGDRELRARRTNAALSARRQPRLPPGLG